MNIPNPQQNLPALVPALFSCEVITGQQLRVMLHGEKVHPPAIDVQVVPAPRFVRPIQASAGDSGKAWVIVAVLTTLIHLVNLTLILCVAL